MIDIKRMRHLIAVASYPTVQAAAESLHITQSALTKSIARFEADLQAPLFDRKGHRLSLTDLGQHLVKRAEELLRQVHTMEEEVSLWKGLGTGEVRIGVDAIAEHGLLPMVLERFVTEYPDIQVNLRSGHTDTLLLNLLENELHFVVADPEIAEGNDDLLISNLHQSPLAAAIRPGHPLEKYDVTSPEDVSLYPRIGAAAAPRFERWRSEQAQRDGMEVLPRSLLTDNYALLVRLAERTNAIVFGPRNLLESFEDENRLQVVDWPLEGPTTQTSLIRMRERHLSPAVEHLIKLVEDIASDTQQMQ